MNMKLPDEEIQKAVDIVKSEYNRKYAGYDRKAQVCFFTNMSMLEGEYAAYDQFCESIGGELARWALKDKYTDLYKPLKENGNIMQVCIFGIRNMILNLMAIRNLMFPQKIYLI